MFTKSKVSQSMIDAVKNIVQEAGPIKEPTSTGMKVYGRSYGNSAKAKQDQTKSSVDTIKGPKTQDLIKKDQEEYQKTKGKYDESAKPDYLDFDKDGNKKESMKKALADKEKVQKEAWMKKEELKGNQDKIDANHNNKIDAQDFAILRNKKKVKEDMHFAKKLIEGFRNKEKLNEKELDIEINEVLSKDASAGDWIHDFVHSDNPKFAGKSKAERKKMALGAYYAKQNEEVEELDEKEGYSAKAARAGKDIGKPGKAFAKIAKSAGERYGSEEKGKKVAGAILAKLRKEETVEESFEDEHGIGRDVADKKEKMDRLKTPAKPGPLHNVGKGIKAFLKGKPEPMEAVNVEGEVMDENYVNPDSSAITTDTLAGRMPTGKINSFKSYKLRVKPIDKEGDGSVKEPGCDYPEKTAARVSIHAEGKRPETDDAPPFDTPYTTGKPDNVKDKSGAVHTPMSRARDLARAAMKKVKTEMLGKTGTTEGKKW